jgi:hypothetical protein
LKALAGGTKEIPFVGAPIVREASKARERLENKLLGLADELGGATRLEAGQSVKDDLIHWSKVGSRREAEEIFSDLHTLMIGAEGKLRNTKAAIDDIVSAAGESYLCSKYSRREPILSVHHLRYEGRRKFASRARGGHVDCLLKAPQIGSAL